MSIITFFKKNLDYLILFFAILSIFFIKYSYISLIISILTLILSFIFFSHGIRIFLASIIISIATIFTNFLILNNKNDEEIDFFKDRNILIGTWNYNFNNSSYIFKEDYSFIKYDDVDNKNNYCVGNYKYSYGGTGDDNVIIKQDDNYYYYDLTFYTDYCVTDNKKDDYNYENKLIFGVNKNDYNDLIFIDSVTDIAYKVNKFID